MKERASRPTAGVIRRLPVFVFLLLMIAVPGDLFAALGGDPGSVQADQAHLQASARSIRKEAYTVQELHAPTGTVVREFVSPGGSVFGVAWEGPWPPDMHQLLGAYFDQFARAMQSASGSRIGRRPVHIELPGLVMEVAGHARSFTGRAYVPQMLPQGMSAGEIR